MIPYIITTYNCIIFYFFLFSFYFIIYLPFSLRSKKKIEGKSKTFYKFAILIPARNEEKNIAHLINTLKRVDYPSDLLRIFFILDNSEDRTKDIICNLGTKNMVFYDKKDGNSGKARAINWFLDKYREKIEECDAVTIFDADNRIDQKFFQRLAGRLNLGEKIIQGNTRAIKIKENTMSMINYLNIEVINFLREQGKSNAGLSCKLRGHGMCFSKDLICNVSFDNESINEDTELTFKLIIKGFRIIWAKECIVYSSFPEEIRNLGTQRMRWTRGRLDTWRRNSFRILKLIFKEKDWKHFDLFLELLLPPLSFLIAINLFNIIVSVLIGNYLFFYISSIYILLIMIIYFSFLIKEGIGLRHVVALPYFLVWRNYISIISLFKKTVKW